MTTSALHRIKRVLAGLPNLVTGYNLHVNRNKCRLIDHVFTTVVPAARSFADLGGVWNVNAAYTRYTLSKYPIVQATIVDTDYPENVEHMLSAFSHLKVIRGDFGDPKVATEVGHVDVAFFFDVLLHQANPHWDEVLAQYAGLARCIVVYNQQYVLGPKSIRLTDLPVEEYTRLTSDRRVEFYHYVYAHRNELHPKYGKPWRDIHNIAQWGITDADLRRKMIDLKYTEVYYRSDGRFLNLPAFENHAFVFLQVPNRT